MSVREAIKKLGLDHVLWILGDFDFRIRGRIAGTWFANDLDGNEQYWTLKKAGREVVEQVAGEMN